MIADARTTMLSYTRAEDAFFRNITEEQWELVDGWVEEKNSIQQFIDSLNEMQESLALVWAMRLRELIDQAIISKATADASDEPIVTESAIPG